MSWFRKRKAPLAPAEKKSRVPEGLWVKCKGCSETLYKKEVIRNRNVCPKCNYHFGLSAAERVALILDGGVFEQIDIGLRSNDPLRFKDTKRYRDRLRIGEENTGLTDAVLSARGSITGIPIILVAMEYAFIGGSMGVVVGEKITRAIELALKERTPLIIISRSGGARMQEGAISLMQMAKISAALARLDEAAVPYISVLTDPTTGGVTASFAMLGDFNIAEPKALIGFAGPRVIEQTIRQPVPPGFQRSEHVLQHGMLDMIVERKDMKETLGRLLRFFADAPPSEGEPAQESESVTGQESVPDQESVL
jgi:acetyl-CoA carboxylase carboxyl transferase subunit beta